jgi:hypothetical protein
MGQIDPHHAARVLATTSWRRDYEGDPKIQQEAFQAEVENLFEAMKKVLSAVIGLLYDNHAMNWGNKTSLHLYEGDKQIVRCYINVESIGTVGVQYFPSIGEEKSEQFEMIRNGKYEYGWVHQGHNLPTVMLAALIIQRILEIGNGVVGYTVKKNPLFRTGEQF